AHVVALSAPSMCTTRSPSSSSVPLFGFFLAIPRPLTSTLFPYTTLFRSSNSLCGDYCWCCNENRIRAENGERACQFSRNHRFFSTGYVITHSVLYNDCITYSRNGFTDDSKLYYYVNHCTASYFSAE